MRLYLQSLVLLGLWLSGMIPATAQKRLIIGNPTSEQRHEVIEIGTELADGDTLLIIRDAFGIEQPWQITQDGKLLLYVSVRPHGEAVYTLERGKPSKMNSYVFGKYYSERADDISFENDRVGFRIYGPETQKRGEKAYGIDLWVKHSSEIVVDDLYRFEFSKHPEIAALRKQGCSTKADSLNAKIAKSLVVGWMLTG